jgi:hypothetical protein
MSKKAKAKEAPKPKVLDEVTANRPAPRGTPVKWQPGGDHWRGSPSPFQSVDPKVYGD